MKKIIEKFKIFVYTCYIRYLSYINDLLEKIDGLLRKIDKN